MKLRTRLLLVLFFLILLPVIIASWIARTELRKNQEAYQVALKGVRIEENNTAQDLLIPASQKLIEAAARNLEHEFAAWGRDAVSLASQIQFKKGAQKARSRLLMGYITDHAGCIRVTVVDWQGQVVQDVPDDRRYAGRDLSDNPFFRSLFRQARRQLKAGASDLVKPDGLTPVYLFCAPVIDKGKFAGAVFTTVHFDAIARLLDNVKLGKTGYAIMINPEGLLLYHPEPSRRFQENWLRDYLGTPLHDLLIKLVSGEQGVGVVTSPKLSGLFAYAPVRTLRAGVGVMVPADDFLKEVPETQVDSFWNNPSVWLPVLVALVCVAAGAVLIIAWLAPWGKLFANAVRVVQGGAAEFDTERRDEVGDIGRGFRRLQTELAEAGQKREGIEQQLTEARHEKEWVDDLLLQKSEALAGAEKEVKELRDAREALSLLPEMFSVLSQSEDVLAGLRSGLTALTARMGLERGCLLLADPAGGGLKGGVGTAGVADIVETLEIPAGAGSIAAVAAAEGAAYNIQDAAGDGRVGRESLALTGTLAFAAVPVKDRTDGRTLAVFLGDNPASQAPVTAETVERLEGVLGHIGPWLRIALQWRELGAEREAALTGRQEMAATVQSVTRDAHVEREALAAMAGEWQDSLEIIKVFASRALASPDPLSEAQQEFVGQLIHRSARLESFLREAIDFSRAGSGELVLTLTPVPLSRLVKDCLLHVQAQADEHRVALRSGLASADIHAPLDEERVRTALIHLLSSAVANTPSGGTVSLSLTRREAQAVVSVSDGGQGLTPTQAERLLSQFHGPESPLGSVAAGTGVRFPMLKRLMEMHGGSLTVTAGTEKGNLFMLVFPVRGSGSGPSPAVQDAIAQAAAEATEYYASPAPSLMPAPAPEASPLEEEEAADVLPSPAAKDPGPGTPPDDLLDPDKLMI